MNSRVIGPFLVATTVFILATIVGGWWTVPIVAVVGTVIMNYRRRLRPGQLAVAGGLAWLLLLGWRALTSPVDELASRLGGLFGQPGWVLPIATPLFALGLVWGVATVTALIIRRNPRTRTKDSSVLGGNTVE